MINAECTEFTEESAISPCIFCASSVSAVVNSDTPYTLLKVL